ncbi:murein hydrolase activator EnvC family protein [Beijerinckia indica]|uniref:Peptidase M23 n=1 Tax=Beijerinckia indica subsp. indica (strain ATCC 9039 / DSM 1715 / NCIMB 8712) TaxID=395963 RepID=B2IKW0_BEII9|nr:peptidoglycan DD-metalloendopeptidase family protein [Beijerinckia indica]ACB96500.1 Peptidase M23 [Beijerinckia indica subsp. indica ATCC 9039]
MWEAIIPGFSIRVEGLPPIVTAATALGLGLALIGHGLAQNASSQETKNADVKAHDLATHKLELRGMQDTLEQSQAQRQKIEAEIASLKADRTKLAAALVETTQNVSGLEEKIAETERRLDTLTASEESIRNSLEGRRKTLSEVLAALQRMGRRAPPALLAAPQDILEAIRTSMLLGAVLPEMRSEAAALVSDLSELVRLRQSISADRDSLNADRARMREERLRLENLIAARQTGLSDAEQALGAERERAAELARQAGNLKDLITRMETEVAAAARGAEAARQADEAQKARAAAGTVSAAAPFKDPARLAPARAFADTKGFLPLPVAGNLLRGYGASDGLGGIEKGLLLATRPEAIVGAPCDGWVAYAGPYRTYGQLLIVNAGQGYYIILAGMERINVNVGQFILAGEAVAVMGDGTAKTAASVAIAAPQPILYVEFRKDGVAIDPGPWWMKPELQKVRG